jgi:type II secretion system protein J
MKFRSSRPSLAFTLLEIMVALALLGLIIIAIYQSWFSIMKGSKVALDAAAAAQRSRIAMRTLEDSLSCACMYSQNIQYYSFIVDSSSSDGDFASLSFVARLPKSFPHGGKFGDLDIRRVSFTIEDGPDSQKQLVMRQNPVLMEVDKDEKVHPLVLARNVKHFIVRFTDPKTGEWTTDWLTTNQIPRRVEIMLQLGELDQYSTKPQDGLFGDVVIAALPVRVEWQMPLGALNPVQNQPGQTNVPPGNPGGNGNFPLQPGQQPGFNPGGGKGFQ